MQNSHSAAVQERNDIFEQVTAALAVSGQPLSEEMRQIFKPLLSGKMTYEQHLDYVRGCYAQS